VIPRGRGRKILKTIRCLRVCRLGPVHEIQIGGIHGGHADALLTSTGSTGARAGVGRGGGIIAPFISRQCVARCSGYALR